MKKQLHSNGEKISPLLYAHDFVSESFNVGVSYPKPISELQTSDMVTSFRSETIYQHECFFSAPSGNDKAKLVILFPGGGGTAIGVFEYMNIGTLLNNIGYAVLAVMGYSREWMAEQGVTTRPAPVGSWYATEETIKAYQYITDKYDWVDKSGCYFYGESQGGHIAENVADFGAIPIKASALDAPALSVQYVQMSLRMDSVRAVYGIESGSFDKNKCIGCDPFTRNVDGEITNVSADNVTAKKRRNTNSPLLLMSCPGDQFVQNWTVRNYAKALMNSGQWVEYRSYSNLSGTTKHGVVQFSPVVGKVGSLDVTSGMVDVLNFFKRNGGYEYQIV